MRGKLGIASIAVVFGAFVFLFLSIGKAPEVHAQRAKTERHAFEYKVIVLTFNPGERLTDAQCATQFRKTTQHGGDSRLGTSDLTAHAQHGADNWRRRDDCAIRRRSSPSVARA